jgi:hypothetical protein
MTIYRVSRVISPFDLDLPDAIRFGKVNENAIWDCSHVLLNFSTAGERRLRGFMSYGSSPLVLSVIDPKDRNNLILAQSQLPIIAEYIDRHPDKDKQKRSITRNGGITVGVMHEEVMSDQRYKDVSRFVTRFIESCNEHPDSVKTRKRIARKRA